MNSRNEDDSRDHTKAGETAKERQKSRDRQESRDHLPREDSKGLLAESPMLSQIMADAKCSVNSFVVMRIPDTIGIVTPYQPQPPIVARTSTAYAEACPKWYQHLSVLPCCNDDPDSLIIFELWLDNKNDASLTYAYSGTVPPYGNPTHNNFNCNSNLSEMCNSGFGNGEDVINTNETSRNVGERGTIGQRGGEKEGPFGEKTAEKGKKSDDINDDMSTMSKIAHKVTDKVVSITDKVTKSGSSGKHGKEGKGTILVNSGVHEEASMSGGGGSGVLGLSYNNLGNLKRTQALLSDARSKFQDAVQNSKKSTKKNDQNSATLLGSIAVPLSEFSRNSKTKHSFRLKDVQSLRAQGVSLDALHVADLEVQVELEHPFLNLFKALPRIRVANREAQFKLNMMSESRIGDTREIDRIRHFARRVEALVRRIKAKNGRWKKVETWENPAYSSLVLLFLVIHILFFLDWTIVLFFGYLVWKKVGCLSSLVAIMVGDRGGRNRSGDTGSMGRNSGGTQQHQQAISDGNKQINFPFSNQIGSLSSTPSSTHKSSSSTRFLSQSPAQIPSCISNPCIQSKPLSNLLGCFPSLSSSLEHYENVFHEWRCSQREVGKNKWPRYFDGFHCCGGTNDNGSSHGGSCVSPLPGSKHVRRTYSGYRSSHSMMKSPKVRSSFSRIDNPNSPNNPNSSPNAPIENPSKKDRVIAFLKNFLSKALRKVKPLLRSKVCSRCPRRITTMKEMDDSYYKRDEKDDFPASLDFRPSYLRSVLIRKRHVSMHSTIEEEQNSEEYAIRHECGMSNNGNHHSVREQGFEDDLRNNHAEEEHRDRDDSGSDQNSEKLPRRERLNKVALSPKRYLNKYKERVQGRVFGYWDRVKRRFGNDGSSSERNLSGKNSPVTERSPVPPAPMIASSLMLSEKTTCGIKPRMRSSGSLDSGTFEENYRPNQKSECCNQNSTCASSEKPGTKDHDQRAHDAVTKDGEALTMNKLPSKEEEEDDEDGSQDSVSGLSTARSSNYPSSTCRSSHNYMIKGSRSSGGKADKQSSRSIKRTTLGLSDDKSKDSFREKLNDTKRKSWKIERRRKKKLENRRDIEKKRQKEGRKNAKELEKRTKEAEKRHQKKINTPDTLIRIESQRSLLWGGFSSSRLQFFDPPPWSDLRGRICDPPRPSFNGRLYRWEIQISAVTDDNGWSYSTGLGLRDKQKLTNKASFRSLFRQRKHIGIAVGEVASSEPSLQDIEDQHQFTRPEQLLDEKRRRHSLNSSARHSARDTKFSPKSLNSLACTLFENGKRFENHQDFHGAKPYGIVPGTDTGLFQGDHVGGAGVDHHPYDTVGNMGGHPNVASQSQFQSGGLGLNLRLQNLSRGLNPNFLDQSLIPAFDNRRHSMGNIPPPEGSSDESELEEHNRENDLHANKMHNSDMPASNMHDGHMQGSHSSLGMNIATSVMGSSFHRTEDATMGMHPNYRQDLSNMPTGLTMRTQQVKVKSEKSGNRNYLRELWDKNIMRFNKQERKLIYWIDFLERRLNLINYLFADDGSQDSKNSFQATSATKDLATSSTSETGSLMLLGFLLILFIFSFFIPPRIVVCSFVIVRFQKGYKKGKYSRRNREIVVQILQHEIRKRNGGLQGMLVVSGTHQKMNQMTQWQQQANQIKLYRSQPMSEIYTFVSQVVLRDLVHAYFYQGAYPLPLAKVQGCATLDDLATLVVNDSLFFLRRNDDAVFQKRSPKLSLSSILDHTASNQNLYRMESSKYYGH